MTGLRDNPHDPNTARTETIAADELRALRERLAEMEEALRTLRAKEADGNIAQDGNKAATDTLDNAAGIYRSFVENMDEGALTVSASDIIVYCNAAFARMVGLSPEHVVGARLSDFVSNLEPPVSPAMGVGGREMKLRTAEKEIDVRIKAALLTVDSEQMQCLVVTDITSRWMLLQHEAIVQSSTDAIYIVNPNLIIETWNSGAEQLYGYSSAEAIGQSWRALLVLPDQHEDFERAMARACAGEVVQSKTIRITKDGSRLDVSSKWTPIQSADGQLLGIAVTSRSLGERKRPEETLRTARDSFRYLVENSPFGVYAIDADFRLVQVGLGAQKIFENVRPLIGRDFAEVLRTIWPEPFASETIRHFRHTMVTGEPYHAPPTILRRHDIDEVESYDWKIERVAMPGSSPVVVCHFYDLSEQQRHETELRDGEERLRFALEAADAGTWEFVPETGTLSPSDRAIALHGLAPDTLITLENILATLHPDDQPQVLNAIKNTRETGIPYDLEIRVCLADGSLRWIESKCMRTGDGARLIGFVRDITERKQTEEHKSIMMREVNHRSKNLLAVIQAVAHLTAASEPKMFALRFSERLMGLAASQDLLVHNEWRGVGLHDLVRSQLAHFTDLIDHRLIIYGPPVQVTTEAAQTIGMALHELLTNAVKYGALSNDVGKIHIAWELDGEGVQQQFSMSWSESGGPPISEPQHYGFGHKVLVLMAEQGLDAAVSLKYPVSGAAWKLTASAHTVITRDT